MPASRAAPAARRSPSLKQYGRSCVLTFPFERFVVTSRGITIPISAGQQAPRVNSGGRMLEMTVQPAEPTALAQRTTAPHEQTTAPHAWTTGIIAREMCTMGDGTRTTSVGDRHHRGADRHHPRRGSPPTW